MQRQAFDSLYCSVFLLVMHVYRLAEYINIFVIMRAAHDILDFDMGQVLVHVLVLRSFFSAPVLRWKNWQKAVCPME